MIRDNHGHVDSDWTINISLDEHDGRATTLPGQLMATVAQDIQRVTKRL